VNQTIDTLLLLALPASGKSEIRRYLGSLEPEVAERDLHLGHVVQLDDYPYVHMMRRIDEELVRLSEPPAFFASLSRPFMDPRDWGTLIHLLNEDYSQMGIRLARPESAGAWLLERIDRARAKVGMTSATGGLANGTLGDLVEFVEGEAASLFFDLSAALLRPMEGSTVVIEFARGGPDGAGMPLEPPHGYAYSLGQLSEEIKTQASILYVWVTPEESRRRNAERARPGLEGDASILFHGVPEDVMLRDYGTDDIIWLTEQGDGGSIQTGGHSIPVAIFDNRVDRTSFLRADQAEWAGDAVDALHEDLSAALASLSR
jgi:hypothetical protein